MQKVTIYTQTMPERYEVGQNGVSEIVTAKEEAAIDWIEVRFQDGRTKLYSQIPYILETQK